MQPSNWTNGGTQKRVHVGLDRLTLATAVDRSGAARMALAIRRAGSRLGERAPRWLTVLTYHRVASPGAARILDEGVVDASPAQLARQMAFVKRWFDVVTTAEVRAFAAGREDLPRNPLLVTFDDGYRDNHDVALPILRDQGVRATFFIATDYVDRRKIYWWDRVSLVLGRTARPEIFLEYPKSVLLRLRDREAGDEAARRAAVRRVQRIIKDHEGLDLDRFMQQLERAADTSVTRDEEECLASDLVMTWDQVRALHEAGMDVQSHTHSHRVLHTLSSDEIDAELRTSRDLLQRCLGAAPTAISYPVGKSIRERPDIVRAVRAAGYEVGFSNATGIGRVRPFDAFDVRRVSMDRDMPDALFRSMLALPWLAY